MTDVRTVADGQLHDAVDEMGGAGRRGVALEDRDLALLLGDHERVRERRQPVAVGPVQDDDRPFDDDALRHVDERTAGEEGVVEHGERVGRRVGDGTEPRLDQGSGRRSRCRRRSRPGLERGIHLVVHDASVAYDDERGVLAELRTEGTTTRDRLRFRRAELARR